MRRMLVLLAVLVGMAAPFSAAPTLAAGSHLAAKASQTCKTVTLTWRHGVSKRTIESKVLWIHVDPGREAGAFGVNGRRSRLIGARIVGTDGKQWVPAASNQREIDFSGGPASKVLKIIAKGRPCR